jgi:hypothetical protein
MAVGLAVGVVAIAFAAVLPDAVAYIYVGAQLAGIGWVYFGFGVADGRPFAIAIQAALSAAAFMTVGYLGAYHHSTLLLGLGYLAMAAGTGCTTPSTARPTSAGGIRRSAWSPTLSWRPAARRVGVVSEMFSVDEEA